jgi:hypothetical protein
VEVCQRLLARVCPDRQEDKNYVQLEQMCCVGVMGDCNEEEEIICLGFSDSPCKRKYDINQMALWNSFSAQEFWSVDKRFDCS